MGFWGGGWRQMVPFVWKAFQAEGEPSRDTWDAGACGSAEESDGLAGRAGGEGVQVEAGWGRGWVFNSMGNGSYRRMPSRGGQVSTDVSHRAITVLRSRASPVSSHSPEAPRCPFYREGD